MIDISDGLVQDACHLAKNSNLTIVLDIEKIPLPSFINLKKDLLLDAALYGGDDYELLFSCSPANEKLINNLSLKANIKISKIGFFSQLKDDYVNFQNYNGKSKKYSYLHF
jgi:thiamine-monophosphate kinase